MPGNVTSQATFPAQTGHIGFLVRQNLLLSPWMTCVPAANSLLSSARAADTCFAAPGGQELGRGLDFDAFSKEDGEVPGPCLLGWGAMVLQVPREHPDGWPAQVSPQAA